MSGRNRNIMPSTNNYNLPARYLPDIITARPSASPYNSYVENTNSHKTRTASSSSDFHHSCASSAISRRFQDLFYKSGWPSLSDTGTDSSVYIEIESSGSSASSMFSWADPDATSLVAEEWEKIQRTLYDEPGPKVHQKHLIDECNQWKKMFTHLRVVGRQCTLNNTISKDYNTEEEILSTQYNSDGDDGNSITSSLNKLVNFDDTKRNNFNFINDAKINKHLPNNQKTVKNHLDAYEVYDELDNCLQVTSLDRLFNNNNSPKNLNVSSIIRSEISSFRWKKKHSSPNLLNIENKNNFQNETQNNFTDRDSSAISVYSFSHKPSLIRRKNMQIPESFKNDVSDYNEKMISAYSTDTASRKNVAYDKTLSLNKIIPIRSISIPHETNSLINKNSRGRNVFLPPLTKKDIKVSSNKTNIYDSDRNKNKTRKKDLDPIILNRNLNPQIDENRLETTKKGKKKRKKKIIQI